MVVSMGCGGSRADTIEPRYYESWTRETESTWLANTDTETAQINTNNNHQRGTADGAAATMKESTATSQGEDGRQSGRGSACAGSSSREKKMVNTGTQCGRQPLHSTTATSGQRRFFHPNEVKAKPKKTSSKEAVTTKSGQQIAWPEEKTPA